MRSFSLHALHDALDIERKARGLSWAELVDEINRPFLGTPSIPIGLGTIRGMRTKRSVTSAVVLQVLRWLKRSPESFLTPAGAEMPAGALPEPGTGRILRFQTSKLFEALNAKRQQYGMTWRQVAAELPGFSESMLRNLQTDPLIGFPRVMVLTQWLGVPAVTFVRDTSR